MRKRKIDILYMLESQILKTSALKGFYLCNLVM